MTRINCSVFIAIVLAGSAIGAEEDPKPVSAPELEQLVAPVALYPDSLVSQILMASTYPLEVVQADRWVQAKEPPLEGDALAKALEAEQWDPSVKSLVNFPSVLTQMSTKLDWTLKLGDAVLSQEKAVLDSIQRLRERAKEAGHLDSTKEQKVTVEKEVIVIQPAKPDVIYVPSYNPTIVYGTWPYPTYPPTYYYPPAYVYPPTAHAFAVGVAFGVAWGYAWGGCGWHSGHVDIDINRNVKIDNRHIDRGKYTREAGGQARSRWEHNSESRKGVRYRDSETANRYGKPNSPSTRVSDAYRGRSDVRSNTPTSREGLADRRLDSGTSRGRDLTTRDRQSEGRTRPASPSTRTTPTRSSNSSSPFSGFGDRSRTRQESSRGRSSRSSSRSSGRSRRGGSRRGGR